MASEQHTHTTTGAYIHRCILYIYSKTYTYLHAHIQTQRHTYTFGTQSLQSKHYDLNLEKVALMTPSDHYWSFIPFSTSSLTDTHRTISEGESEQSICTGQTFCPHWTRCRCLSVTHNLKNLNDNESVCYFQWQIRFIKRPKADGEILPWTARRGMQTVHGSQLRSLWAMCPPAALI